MKIHSVFMRTTLTLLASAVLLACSPKAEQQQGALPVVSVISATPQTVTVENSLSGRLESSRTAEVRARVPGVLLKRLFEEGSMVKAGQPLFTIDDSPYRATAASAKATFTKASADLSRLRPLMEAGAISKQEWDAAVQAYEVAKANRDTANINLGYAHVKAPISGRISRAEVTEGALVGQNGATLLATIHQDNPLYVNFTQSADEMMKMRRAIADGSMKSVQGAIPVTVFLNDGTEYEHKGKLLFTDPTVNPTTGQVSLRAIIPNDEGVLFPGLFVSVHIATAEIPNAILLPQQAVTRGQADTVMIVKADGTYEPRPVVVAGQQNNHWIVTSGLNAGDQVIVDGMAVVQMTGSPKVQTKPWGVDMPPAGAMPQGQGDQAQQQGQPENNSEAGQPENANPAEQGQPEKTRNQSEQPQAGQPETSSGEKQ